MRSPAMLGMTLVLSVCVHAGLIVAIGSLRPGEITVGPGQSRLILTARLQKVEEPVYSPAAASAELLDAPHPQNSVKRPGSSQASVDSGDAANSPPGSRYYFNVNELDQNPTLAMPVELDDVVGLTSDDGAAILRFWISAEGTVDLLTFEESSFPDEVAERLRNHVELLIFVPGKIRGISVPSTLRVEIKLKDDKPSI